MGEPLRVLVVEDSEDDTLLIVHELQRGGYTPSFERVDTATAMSAALEGQKWDVVTADYVLPHFSGPDALKLLQESGLDLPFIVVSGKIGEDTAVAAMKAGAHDYIMKNNMTRLPAAVERELQEAEVRRERREADEALRKAREELEVRVEERTRDLAEANAELLVEVAEREQAEAKLKESEEKLKTILGNTRDVIFQLSPLGIIQYVSPKVTEIYGYRVEELIGEHLSKTTPDDELPKALETLAEVLAGRELTLEINQLDSEGNIVPMEINATPVRRGGKIAAIQGVMRDLSERNQVEDALRESEQFNSSLLRNSPYPILVLNPDTSVKYVNPALERLTGFTSAELIGKKAPYPWLTEESLPRTIEEFEVAMRRGTSWFEELFQNKGGVQFWVEITSAPIRYNGELTYYMSSWVDITERKQAEEALRESEDRYRSLVENADEAIYISQGEMLKFVNAKATELSGYSREELLSMNFTDIIHPDDLEAAMKYYVAMLEGGESPDAFSLRIIDKEGNIRWVEVRATRVTWQGEPATLGFMSDITERKRAEEALRESRNRYLESVNLLPQTVFELDEKGNLTFANRHGTLAFGYTLEDVQKGLNAIEFLVPEHKGKAREIIHGILNGEQESGTNEYTALRKDGTTFPVIVYASAIARENQPVGLRGVMLDITERKQAEEALRASRSRFRDLANLLPQSVWELDKDGYFTFSNQEALRSHGYTLEGIRDRSEPMLSTGAFIPEDRDRVRQNAQRVMNGEHLDGTEYTALRKDGSTFPVVVYSAPIIQGDEVVGLRGVTVDITERRKMEEERRRSDKLESVGTLAGGVAHDFNNLLTGIMGNISLAKRYTGPEEKAFERLVEAEKASLRAKDLTQQLLTFARGGAPVKKTASIGELIRDSAGFALRGSNVRCQFSLADDLWAVEIDEGQISQVINNLVINADQAMPEGGALKIGARNTVIRARNALPLRKGKYVEITMEDPGVGISKEHLLRIFDPYFTTKQKGSGLGLATSYSIIKNHDGHITISSELGAGTAVHMYLPASGKKPQSKEKATAETPVEGKVEGRGRVLVMDDEETIRELLSEELTDIGYEVELTSGGAEAIETYQKAGESGQAFDAVILDLTVPGEIGGKEVIRKLLELDPGVKAIVSSGYSIDPVMADFEKHGFSAVAAKPYRIEELEETLRSILERKE